MEDFVHLHVHTYYSLLDGQSSVKRLVDKAINNGMKGMAITDHGNMFGVKDLHDYCKDVNKKLKAEGKEPFKPIFGCEMYVARRKKENTEKGHGDLGGWHLIVLAKNKTGYQNLIKLVSRSWLNGFYGKPRTDHDDLEKFREGLIVCSACIAGEVPSWILSGNIEEARKAIEWHKRIFGNDYYLELQRHEVKDPNQNANRETFPLQQKANTILIELAKEYSIKLICTNDCHFVDEDNAEAHDHLLCLATNKALDDPTRMLYSKQEWFKTREEMNEIFQDIPEALHNTTEILDKIEIYSIDHEPIMPFFPIPESFGTEDEWRKKYTEDDLYKEFCSDENGENPLSEEDGEKRIKHLGGYDKIYRIKFEADYLGELAYNGAKKLYGNPAPTDVVERIKFELHVMKTMGFPGYFLIVQDFINSARNELDVWVGPGRGSAAGSVVAYCLGITKIDPLKYDLLFERFLNPDRISLPDIDTDFDDDGRGKVLKWVMDKYGHENCAHIITYSTMATKNSIKDVARVEKLPLDYVNALCKAIPDTLPDNAKMNLTNAIKYTTELQAAENSENLQTSNTIKYAKMLEGTVRGTGIHACGFIICRDPISDWVPLSTAEDPNFKGEKVPVTQYDGHVIESTGLIKMDFLGLKTLSELKEAVKNVKLTRGIDIDLDTIPIDDPLTYKLYQEGKTIGTFQFESPGMQKYLRELHPEVFGDLIAMNALYRPGPMDNIPSFIRRKLGQETITYPIPEMEKYLKDTYGICVYQEQVMLLSRLLAGFTRGQSDSLRKAMGKKKIKDMEALEVLFYKGGEERGHDHDTLNKIWEEWKKFASYAFNKSHAACYSWVSFQTAYMKAHYPAEFMAAIMTRRMNDIKETTKLMDECKSMGIATLLPDVNESYCNFGVNKEGQIRFGLAAIKNMGTTAAESIIQERDKNGPFVDIYNFMERLNFSCCNRKNIESLVLSGALDCFGIKREQYFAKDNKGDSFIDILLKYGTCYQLDKEENSNNLFGDIEEFEITRPSIPALQEEWTLLDRLNKERELIGIYLSAHPLDPYNVVLKEICNVTVDQLSDISNIQEKQIRFGGIVTEIKTGLTKRMEQFGIIKLEDYNGPGELRLFGKNWTDYRTQIQVNDTICITASIQPRRWGTGKELFITSIDQLSEVKKNDIHKLTISLNLDELSPVFCKELTSLFRKYPGSTEVVINVTDPKQKIKINLKSLNTTIEVSKEIANFLENYKEIKYNIN